MKDLKTCGTCKHMLKTTHKYDEEDPPTLYTICDLLPCKVFGEWAERCSASVIVTEDFGCMRWEAKGV
jgi:hypothetical protein